MADAVAIKTEQKVPSVSYAAPIAEQKAFAKKGNVEGAIANLLQLEKTARLVWPPSLQPAACLACRGQPRSTHAL